MKGTDWVTCPLEYCDYASVVVGSIELVGVSVFSRAAWSSFGRVSLRVSASPVSMSIAAAPRPIIDWELAVSIIMVATFQRRWKMVLASITVWMR